MDAENSPKPSSVLLASGLPASITELLIEERNDERRLEALIIVDKSLA
jgi:hypothetical protein